MQRVLSDAACMERCPSHSFAHRLPSPSPANAGAFARRVSALLLVWVLEGWLLPTLLLQYTRAAQQEGGPQQPQPAGEQSSSIASRAAGVYQRALVYFQAAAASYMWLAGRLDLCLQGLLPSLQQQRRQRQGQAADSASEALALLQPSRSLQLMLQWWVVVVGAWAACCYAASWFEPIIAS